MSAQAKLWAYLTLKQSAAVIQCTGHIASLYVKAKKKALPW
jgi:hypothetical protein